MAGQASEGSPQQMCSSWHGAGVFYTGGRWAGLGSSLCGQCKGASLTFRSLRFKAIIRLILPLASPGRVAQGSCHHPPRALLIGPTVGNTQSKYIM